MPSSVYNWYNIISEMCISGPAATQLWQIQGLVILCILAGEIFNKLGNRKIGWQSFWQIVHQNFTPYKMSLVPWSPLNGRGNSVLASYFSWRAVHFLGTNTVTSYHLVCRYTWSLSFTNFKNSLPSIHVVAKTSNGFTVFEKSSPLRIWIT